jgi:hypothetical protein
MSPHWLKGSDSDDGIRMEHGALTHSKRQNGIMARGRAKCVTDRLIADELKALALFLQCRSFPEIVRKKPKQLRAQLQLFRAAAIAALDADEAPNNEGKMKFRGRIRQDVQPEIVTDEYLVIQATLDQLELCIKESCAKNRIRQTLDEVALPLTVEVGQRSVTIRRPLPGSSGLKAILACYLNSMQGARRLTREEVVAEIIGVQLAMNPTTARKSVEESRGPGKDIPGRSASQRLLASLFLDLAIDGNNPSLRSRVLDALAVSGYSATLLYYLVQASHFLCGKRKPSLVKEQEVRDLCAAVVEGKRVWRPFTEPIPREE